MATSVAIRGGDSQCGWVFSVCKQDEDVLSVPLLLSSQKVLGDLARSYKVGDCR